MESTISKSGCACKRLYKIANVLWASFSVLSDNLIKIKTRKAFLSMITGNIQYLFRASSRIKKSFVREGRVVIKMYRGIPRWFGFFFFLNHWWHWQPSANTSEARRTARSSYTCITGGEYTCLNRHTCYRIHCKFSYYPNVCKRLTT